MHEPSVSADGSAYAIDTWRERLLVHPAPAHIPPVAVRDPLQRSELHEAGPDKGNRRQAEGGGWGDAPFLRVEHLERVHADAVGVRGNHTDSSRRYVGQRQRQVHAIGDRDNFLVERDVQMQYGRLRAARASESERGDAGNARNDTSVHEMNPRGCFVHSTDWCDDGVT